LKITRLACGDSAIDMCCQTRIGGKPPGTTARITTEQPFSGKQVIWGSYIMEPIPPYAGAYAVIPSGLKRRGIASRLMNSTGAPNASPIASPTRHPNQRASPVGAPSSWSCQCRTNFRWTSVSGEIRWLLGFVFAKIGNALNIITMCKAISRRPGPASAANFRADASCRLIL